MSEPQTSLRTLGLGLLLVLCLLTAGCATDEDAGDDASDTQEVRQAEECHTETSSDDRSVGAQVACRNAAGSDTHGVNFECPDPERSAVSMAANLTSGSLTVRVQDANAAPVFEQTYEHRDGEFDDSREIGEGESGGWALMVERSDDLEGAFGVRAACAR